MSWIAQHDHAQLALVSCHAVGMLDLARLGQL